MWRRADEALLGDLRAEARIRTRVEHPETARRLAPLVNRLSLSGGLDAPDPRVLCDLGPVDLHRATVLATRQMDSEAAARAAIFGWVRLAVRHRPYLEGIARASLGAAFSPADDPLEDVHLKGLDVVGRELLVDAETLAPRGVMLRRALLDARALAELAGAGPAELEHVGARADRIRASSIEAIVGPIERALADLSSTDWHVRDAAGWLGRAEQAWRWAGDDVELELFVVQSLPNLAWPLHQAQRWDELRTLLIPVEAPSERLAARLLADPTEVAFRASAAQALVFLAETAGTLERQLELAERALATCSSLRNARVVCADRLACKAEQLLIRSNTDTATRDAAALASRARELHPALRRLPALEADIARRGRAEGHA